MQYLQDPIALAPHMRIIGCGGIQILYGGPL